MTLMANQMDCDKSIFGGIYKATEAKFSACLLWMIFQATKDGENLDIPSEIMNPTDITDNGEFEVKLPISDFLTNGEVYFKVCARVLNLQTEPQSFWGVIQAVSKHGFYVVSPDGEAVSDLQLQDSDRFHLNAHIALMESLLMAYSATQVTVQQIVSAVRRFSSFNATKELPFDLEDALILWMNKVNIANDITYYQKKIGETSSGGRQRFRFKKDQLQDRSSRLFPMIEELHSDLRDGKSLLSLILFYCPESITVDCIKLTTHPTSDESIHNIELFRELCAQHVTTSVFSLRTEDFYYCNPLLKSNFLALLCDIFARVELEKDFSNSLASDISQKDNVIGSVKPPRSDDTRLYANSDNRTTVDHGHYDAGSKVDGAGGYTQVNFNNTTRSNNASSKGKDEKQMSGKHGMNHPATKGNDAATVKSRQPLLSKRSKQQLANLDAGKPVQGQDNRQAVQIDDYDFHNSAMFTSGTDRANVHLNPSQSFHAWKTGDLVPTQEIKPAKISLDFKPDVTSSRPRAQDAPSAPILSSTHRHGMEHETARGDNKRIGNGDIAGPRLSWINTESLREFEDLEKLHASRQNTPAAQTSKSSPDLVDRISLASVPNGPLDVDELEQQSDFEPDELYDDGKSDDLNESITSEDLDDFRLEVLRRVQHEKNTKSSRRRPDPNVEFDEPQFEDDDVYGLGQNSGFVQTTHSHVDYSPRPVVPNSTATSSYGLTTTTVTASRDTYYDEHLDDDLLSTITEGSEPTSPSVYSFESTATLSDNAGTPKINLSRETLNQDLSEGLSDTDGPQSHERDFQRMLSNEGQYYENTIGPIRTQGATSADFHTRSTFEDAPLTTSISSVSSSRAENYTPDLRSSYTVSHGYHTIDHARAAGLPVITDVEPSVQNGGDSRRNFGPREDYRAPAVGIQGHGSQEGSDFEDVPIIIRTGSRSSRSRSSSSGISVDDGRLPVESEAEDVDRPGLAVYSSLSEQTGGSPSTCEVEDPDEAGNGNPRRPSRSRRQRPDTWYGSSTDAQRFVPRERSASESAAEEINSNRDNSNERQSQNAGCTNTSSSLLEGGSVSIPRLSTGYPPTSNSMTYRVGSIDEGTVSDDEKLSLNPRILDRRRALKKHDRQSSALVDAFLPLTRSRSAMQVDKDMLVHMNDMKTTTSIVLSKVSHDDSRDNGVVDKLTWLDLSKERNELSRTMDNSFDGDTSIQVTQYERGPETSWAKAYADRTSSRSVYDSSSGDETDGFKAENNLGSRLASLRMQLEERRKHIEKEKKKMVEKWNEERVKSAQNVFWLMIGKDKKEPETTENLQAEQRQSGGNYYKPRKSWDVYVPKDEPNEADSECSPNEDRSSKKKGLVFFPLNETKSPLAKALDFKEGPHTLNSPPMECSTPLSPQAYNKRMQTSEHQRSMHVETTTKEFMKVTNDMLERKSSPSPQIMTESAFNHFPLNAGTTAGYSGYQQATTSYSMNPLVRGASQFPLSNGSAYEMMTDAHRPTAAGAHHVMVANPHHAMVTNPHHAAATGAQQASMTYAHHATVINNQYATATNAQYASATDAQYATAADAQYATAADAQYVTATSAQYAAATNAQYASATDTQYVSATDAQYASTTDTQYATVTGAQYATATNTHNTTPSNEILVEAYQRPGVEMYEGRSPRQRGSRTFVHDASATRAWPEVALPSRHQVSPPLKTKTSPPSWSGMPPSVTHCDYNSVSEMFQQERNFYSNSQFSSENVNLPTSSYQLDTEVITTSPPPVPVDIVEDTLEIRQQPESYLVSSHFDYPAQYSEQTVYNNALEQQLSPRQHLPSTTFVKNSPPVVHPTESETPPEEVSANVGELGWQSSPRQHYGESMKVFEGSNTVTHPSESSVTANDVEARKDDNGELQSPRQQYASSVGYTENASPTFHPVDSQSPTEQVALSHNYHEQKLSAQQHHVASKTFVTTVETVEHTKEYDAPEEQIVNETDEEHSYNEGTVNDSDNHGLSSGETFFVSSNPSPPTSDQENKSKAWTMSTTVDAQQNVEETQTVVEEVHVRSEEVLIKDSETIVSEEEKATRRRSGGIALDIALSDSPSSQNDVRVADANLAGMTPEQLKKREKFIQNRLKQQQEMKAKREADMEKRRRKEEKMKERKEMLEKKEEEGKEKLRKKRQEEEELLRKKAEEEEALRKREEQLWRLRHFTSTKEDVEIRRTVERFKPISHTSSSHSGSTGQIHSPEEEVHTGHGSTTFREYSGPPVYVKPSGKSNRKIIVNAISHCCLSGEVNKEAKDKCLQVLSSSDSSHFFVLFRDGLKFRGLYSFSPEADVVTKLYGVGPRHVTTKMIEHLFKYNSGGKEFSQIHAKSFSIQVDGMTIKKEFWTSNKQGVSKTNTNLKKYPSKTSLRK